MIEIKKPIEAVFLDLGWTLLYPVSGDWFFSKKVRSHVNFDFFSSCSERYDNAFKKASTALFKNHLVTTSDDEFKLFTQFYFDFFSEFPELKITKKISSEFAYEKVYDDSIYQLFEDTIPTLEALSKNFKLGIISDTWPTIVRWLKNAKIWHYFDTHTFSCDLNVIKPHSKMYTDALSKIGVPAQRTVFVDDLIGNVLAAKEHGIQPILITASPTTEKTDEVVCIEKISDLPQILI